MLALPKTDVSIRTATLDDVPFMDVLQKANGRALGWFPTKQFEGYVGMQAVLVAEYGRERVGYVIAKDRYSGRDDLGAIYQMAVVEEMRRKNVAASLVKAVFERAAYGCRLFCCWCAQDLAANRFWQSVGFVPIAYRTGSRTKGKNGGVRMHILWQRRVNAGDETPYWYPFETKNGAIREHRLVFPMTPGESWADAKPVVLPESCRKPAALVAAEQKQLADLRETKKVERREAKARRAEREQAEAESEAASWTTKIVGGRVTRVRKKSQTSAPMAAVEPMPVEAPKAKKEREPMQPYEAAAVAFCRELRDRWAERVAEEPWMLEAAGKYDVARLPAGREASQLPTKQRALPMAA
jgi:ribosomal protein S18 acetylase RimI-like enzyme